ncbi:oligosaccharide flippase family protein [Pontimicrobium sp. MEBiC01747]
MTINTKILKQTITPEHVFMLSVLVVNGGNYLYNLILGRLLGPEAFADAAVLITFLLVLSFMAMTFQLVTAKFSVLFEADAFTSFISRMYRNAVIVGLLLGIATIVFSKQLQELFNTATSTLFVVFGFGVPLYFLMSVNRGVFQGKKAFKSLSITYQTEMLSRLLITLGLLYFLDIPSSTAVAIGILVSLGFGLLSFKMKNFKITTIKATYNTKLVRNFFAITAFYELTQIIINNSDILLVKHYFDAYDAGLYAALALIGRIVYFIAWMFVMLLLPTVVQLKKEGKATAPILLKYVGYISAIASVIILGCALCPKLVISLLFGEDYLIMSPLLWQYALATGLFAVSNIFAYYYLSLDRYIPVVLSGVFGLLQVGLIMVFHNSLAEVVTMQIVAMVLLLIVQLAFFFLDYFRIRD